MDDKSIDYQDSDASQRYRTVDCTDAADFPSQAVGYPACGWEDAISLLPHVCLTLGGIQ